MYVAGWPQGVAVMRVTLNNVSSLDRLNSEITTVYHVSLRVALFLIMV